MVRMASLAWVGPEHARFSRREVGATACHNSAQAFRIQVSEVLAPWTELPRWLCGGGANGGGAGAIGDRQSPIRERKSMFSCLTPVTDPPVVVSWPYWGQRIIRPGEEGFR